MAVFNMAGYLNTLYNQNQIDSVSMLLNIKYYTVLFYVKILYGNQVAYVCKTDGGTRSTHPEVGEMYQSAECRHVVVLQVNAATNQKIKTVVDKYIANIVRLNCAVCLPDMQTEIDELCSSNNHHTIFKPYNNNEKLRKNDCPRFRIYPIEPYSLKTCLCRKSVKTYSKRKYVFTKLFKAHDGQHSSPA